MHPFLLHSMIFDWLMHNTDQSVTDANHSAYECVYAGRRRYSGLYHQAQLKREIQRGGRATPVFQAKEAVMLDLLHILAAGQVHRVATISDRAPLTPDERLTVWIAYNPADGAILAYTAAYDLHLEDGCRYAFAKKLSGHLESRILNYMLGQDLVVKEAMRLFRIYTLRMRFCFDLSQEDLPYELNGVTYTEQSLLDLDRSVLAVLPMILDYVGWTLEEDQRLTADEVNVQAHYITVEPVAVRTEGQRYLRGEVVAVYRCVQGVVEAIRFDAEGGNEDLDTEPNFKIALQVWATPAAPAREVIEV